jgi:hypothetical protein
VGLNGSVHTFLFRRYAPGLSTARGHSVAAANDEISGFCCRANWAKETKRHYRTGQDSLVLCHSGYMHCVLLLDTVTSTTLLVTAPITLAGVGRYSQTGGQALLFLALKSNYLITLLNRLHYVS